MDELIKTIADIKSDFTLTEESIEFVDQLEKITKALVKKKKELVADVLGRGSVDIGRYRFKRTEVFKKVVNDGVEPDKKFLKTEVKINTAAVNAHLKEHKTLPEGITEIFSHNLDKMSDTVKAKESRAKQKAYMDSLKPQISNPLANINFKKRK